MYILFNLSLFLDLKGTVRIISLMMGAREDSYDGVGWVDSNL